MSCGVGFRCGLDPELLWLWCRPEATVPIPPLAWGLPHAAGEALKKTKKKICHFRECVQTGLEGIVLSEVS